MASPQFTVCRITNDDIFVPYCDSDGNYTLYSKDLSTLTGKRLHHRENKVVVATLGEAVELFRVGRYSWRLRGERTGQCNTFTRDIVIEEVRG